MLKAVQAVINGDWQQSHHITQHYFDNTANWLYAVLHKIEGDRFNSNYWYAKTTGKKFTDFKDANKELLMILKSLS